LLDRQPRYPDSVGDGLLGLLIAGDECADVQRRAQNSPLRPLLLRRGTEKDVARSRASFLAEVEPVGCHFEIGKPLGFVEFVTRAVHGNP
jgi:hypothetical protein